ncbi:MAG: hypothetical protein IJ449_01205 [Clostridia bacterium]|nr:hypothetical protein [Clostridia bacterium]
MELCKVCGRPVTRDEIGLTKKLINRGAVEFFCKTCLSKKFEMTEAECDTLIAHFREAGCHLFV